MARVGDVFLRCERAIRDGVLIHRASQQDKEFHFQNWFQGRLQELALAFDPPGRNTYPDFRLVETAEGYEVKGLAFPGRIANYDSNSQVPSGFHNAREIYYVFGRYPKENLGPDFAVYDLVMCHGDFLNADHTYVHANKNIKGFGSYGDIMVRDRKMYVAPTPFALTNGTAREITLILLDSQQADGKLIRVGELNRSEAEHLVVGYAADLQTNTLMPRMVPNPGYGTVHRFAAYRHRDHRGPDVTLIVNPDLDAANMVNETSPEE